MKLSEIKSHTEARDFLVDLVGDMTTRDLYKLVGYTGWSPYKRGACEISAISWFKIYFAVMELNNER